MLPLPFGTRSAYTDSFPSPPPSQVTISQETCFNLSMFRNVVRQYRKMDDQIITRLNRAQAQMRDQFRIASSSTYSGGRSSNGSAQDAEAMCLQLWHEMMTGWAHRQTMLSFCIQTVNSSIEAKNPAGLSGADEKLIGSSTSAAGGSRHRGWKEDEVLANSLQDEESVEAIIRKRTLEAFKSRCPFFSPPASDTTSRTWWELAERGRIGRGPDLA